MSNKLNTRKKPTNALFVVGGIALTSCLVSMTGSSASAAVLTTGQTLTANFSQAYATPNPTNTILSALLDVTLTNITNTAATLQLKLKNTSTLGTFDKANIASVGFAVDPNATSVGFAQITSSGDTNKFDAAILGKIPSLNNVEVCAYSSNNCNGGPIGAQLAQGETDTFEIVLNGAFNGSLTFDDRYFGIKYQTTQDSREFYASSVSAVPEPLTILGAATAAGIGAAFKRRSAKQSKE